MSTKQLQAVVTAYVVCGLIDWAWWIHYDVTAAPPGDKGLYFLFGWVPALAWPLHAVYQFWTWWLS